MPLGEKVAEEKGKATGMSIKSIGPEGTTIEISTAGEVKGFGRHPSGRSMATQTVLEGPSTSRATGQGVLATTDGESLPWHAYGIGRTVGGRAKGIYVLTFSTHSQKYAWMNDALFVVDAEISADLSEFSTTNYEWK